MVNHTSFEIIVATVVFSIILFIFVRWREREWNSWNEENEHLKKLDE